MRIGLFCLLPLVLGALLTSDSPAGEPRRFMMSLELAGRKIEGTPLDWSEAQVRLLARDGRLWEFAPGDARNHAKTTNRFSAYSANVIRDQLRRELGQSFEVTGTGHYLVAHPKGEGAAWSGRLEELYRSCLHYFRRRGFELEQPEFPLVAIVWSKQEDMLRYAAAEGATLSPGTLGYYSPTSNRVTLFDLTQGRGSADWEENAATIIHEAAHQTLFNCGVHNRFAECPRWVVEGLGTMFEAPGVYNSKSNPSQSQRINRGRLLDFKSFVAAGRPKGRLAEFIGSDREFSADPAKAYAEAWALTFYLVESFPRQYAAYLKRTAARDDFATYSPAERLTDFTAEFGKDLGTIEARYLRFVAGLK